MTKSSDVCKIYKITNNETGKFYIGQTWFEVEYRFMQHINDKKISCPKLFYSMNFHGRDKFSVECLVATRCQGCVDYLEDYFINFFDTLKNGYNSKTGGRAGKHSEESKRKISIGNKGKRLGIPMSEAARKKLSLSRRGRPSPMRGKKLSEETKKKIGELAKVRHKGSGNPMFGKKHSEATRALIGANSSIRNVGEGNPMFGKTGELSPLFGRHHSEEVKLKIGKGNKGKIINYDTRKKIAKALTGKKLSMESITKRETTRKLNAKNKKAIEEQDKNSSNTIYKLYKISNNIDDKCFIDYTWKSLDEVFIKHKNERQRDYQEKLFIAMNNVGRDNFFIEHIASTKCENCAEYMKNYAIDLNDSRKNGYNKKIVKKEDND